MMNLQFDAAWLIGLCCMTSVICQQSLWETWWSYDGVSGPEFWGIVRPEWVLCSKGRRQSPVDISPALLLYDRNLKHPSIDRHKVPGLLVNTGQDVTIYLDDKEVPVFLTDGGLSYKYIISRIQIHFGSRNGRGSEHTIDGQAFPAEVQILAYNSELYNNLSHAELYSGGVAAIAVLIQIAERTDASNVQLREIILLSDNVKYKGRKMRIDKLSVHGFLPDTRSFITYEGSLTQPGCYESVSWIIMNKPIYVTYPQLMQLREVLSAESDTTTKVLMEDNFRPVKPLNGRVLRTNINFPKEKDECTMEIKAGYKANARALKRREDEKEEAVEE